MSYEAKSTLGFMTGFLLFYFLSCWLGVDIFGIHLGESWETLGNQASWIKGLIVVSPIIAMLIAGCVGGAMARSDPEIKYKRKPVKFFGSFLITFIIALTFIFMWASSIVVGIEPLCIWLKQIGEFKFRFLFHFIAPSIGLIGGSMLTIIFAGRPEDDLC